MKDQYNLLGKKFNKWTVISLSDYREERSRDRFWICRCECGLEKPVKACYLKSGQSRQCVQCAHDAAKIKGRKMPRMYWQHLIYNANRRQLAFGISQDDILSMMDSQKHKCALSGLPVMFAETESGHKAGKTTASIDRIDPDQGYVKGNVQIVHKIINFMKHTLGQEEFLLYCKMIVEHSGATDERHDQAD